MEIIIEPNVTSIWRNYEPFHIKWKTNLWMDQQNSSMATNTSFLQSSKYVALYLLWHQKKSSDMVTLKSKAKNVGYFHDTLNISQKHFKTRQLDSYLVICPDQMMTEFDFIQNWTQTLEILTKCHFSSMFIVEKQFLPFKTNNINCESMGRNKNSGNHKSKENTTLWNTTSNLKNDTENNKSLNDFRKIYHFNKMKLTNISKWNHDLNDTTNILKDSAGLPLINLTESWNKNETWKKDISEMDHIKPLSNHFWEILIPLVSMMVLIVIFVWILLARREKRKIFKNQIKSTQWKYENDNIRSHSHRSNTIVESWKEPTEKTEELSNYDLRY